MGLLRPQPRSACLRAARWWIWDAAAVATAWRSPPAARPGWSGSISLPRRRARLASRHGGWGPPRTPRISPGHQLRWLLAPHGMRRKLDERLLGGGARNGAVGDQALAGLGDVQDLALELEQAGPWVVDALEHRPADLDLVRGPHLGELRGEREQFGDEAFDLGVARVAGVPGAQVGDRGPGEAEDVLVVPDGIGWWPAEHPADHVPVRVPGQVADEGYGELVPGQDVVGGVDHVGGRGGHAVQQVPDARRDLAAWPCPLRRDLAGHPEQVIPLVGGQHQRAGQRGQHLPRWMRAAALFQPDVVVDRHAGQLGDL